MKILESTINGFTLNVKLDSSVEVYKVYLDSLSNEDNFFSENDESHTHTIVINNTVSDISIDITKFKETAFVVTVVSLTNDKSLAIDKDALYTAKTKMLVTFCDTCLDDTRKNLIVLCELRSNLLDYALQYESLLTALQLYKDLARILVYLDSNISVFDEGFWNYLGVWNCSDTWACKPGYKGEGDPVHCSPCLNGCCAI